MSLKVEILYPHVVGASGHESKGPDFFAQYHKRFVDSFNKFPPEIDCRLKVILCGMGDTDAARDSYSGIANHGFATYDGKGWDIGASSTTAKRSSRDLVICCVTPTYFREEGWLVPIVEAFEKYGDGLYGTSASYQGLPHIRTGCFAFSPAMIRKYPWEVDSRDTGLLFESGVAPGRVEPEKSFTNWMLAQGKPVKLVTRDACCDLPEWRTPDNIFRRGDQSNALAWDRHFDIFDAAEAAEKSALANLSDGGMS